jgi:apolipoprotein D and lipocalin family protein
MKSLRRVSIALSLGTLCACAPPADRPFRDVSAPIGATTRFDPVRFSGEWVLIASFTPQKRAPLAITVGPEAATLSLTSNEVPRLAGFYREGAPGELIPVDPVQEALIVMWVDEDFQTAAIGTVSGSFGAVLNRTADLRSDRATAAREIFDFYGWDTSQLRSTIP